MFLFNNIFFRDFALIKVLSPFYIFQLFSCISWFADEYVTYASCIVFITVVSVIVTLYEVRKVFNLIFISRKIF
jgi:hypothetical protein